MTRKSPAKTETDFWTDARVEQLVKLYEDGLTFGAIGKVIGTSRTAPAGKVWRMRAAGYAFKREYIPEAERIAKRRKTTGSSLAPRRNVSTKSNPPLVRPALPPVDASHAKPWLERLFGECAFPISGEAADTFSCCLPTGDRAYCPAHRAIMFVAPPTKPERIAPWGTREAAA